MVQTKIYLFKEGVFTKIRRFLYKNTGIHSKMDKGNPLKQPILKYGLCYFTHIREDFEYAIAESFYNFNKKYIK